MRYALNIGYDGTNYHGWQIQPNATTVQQLMNNAISKISREKINVVGCGRTDTGVHASYFVLHFDLEQPITDKGKFLYHLNAVLPKDIVAYEVVSVQADFHARFDATAREYHYMFSKYPHPFLYQYTKHLVQIPDVDILHKAAAVVKDNTDFGSFCKAHGAQKTTICNVSESEWIETDMMLVYRIKADRFLRNMVRALVGTMFEIGMRKKIVADFQDIFDARNRSKAGMSVDAGGLFLTGVWYEYVPFDVSSRLPFRF